MVKIDPLIIGSVTAGVAFLMPIIAKKGIVKEFNKEEIFCRTGLRVISEEEKNLLALKINKAGSIEKPEHLWGRKVIYAGAYLLGVSIAGLLFRPHIAIMFFLYCAVCLPWMLPSFMLNRAIERRKSELLRGLSEFTMYLSTALNSMPNTSLALLEASKAAGGLYQHEIDQVLKETNSGKSLQDSLHDWAQRVEVEEIDSLVSALNQIHTKGTPASEKMKEYSERIRMTRRFEIMEQAGKLSIRLIFIVMLFMLIPTLLVIGYPAAFNLMQVL